MLPQPPGTPSQKVRRFLFLSTSKLQQQTSTLLSTYLGQYTIRENHRPEWLEGLELDFYIEELQVGIEVQGQQHFEYTPYFHNSYDDFLEQRDRDDRKSDLCQHHNIELYEVTDGEDVLDVIEDLTQVELPDAVHPNYTEYLHRIARWKAKKQNPNTHQAKAIPKRAKVYIRKLTRLCLQERTAMGSIALKNLERAKEKRIEKLVRIVGRQAAQEMLKEIMDVLPHEQPKPKYTETSQIRAGAKTRKHARKRHVKAFCNNLYLVCGGNEQHVVWFESLDTSICDCRNWDRAPNHICCHIYAVGIYNGVVQ